MPSLPVVIAVAAICCIIGSAIGSSRGRGGDGALLGLLLGPLGVILALALKSTPAYAAARAEAIEAERAKLRAERDGTDER
jgi:uncharacterized protein YqgC (DUF456 family)